jgi:Flp pilus assembly protein TadG
MLNKCFLLKIRNRKGQSIVELSLITPLLLVALYVPVDFGVAFSVAHFTQNAVREAARRGSSITFDEAAIEADALSRMPAWLANKTATATLHTTGAPCAQFVQVVGQGDYTYFLYRVMKLFGADIDDTLPIARTARMRYVFQPATNDTPCT